MQMAWRVHKKGVIIGAGTKKTSEATLKCDKSKITQKQCWPLRNGFWPNNTGILMLIKKVFFLIKKMAKISKNTHLWPKYPISPSFFCYGKFRSGETPPLDFLRGKRGLVGIIYLLQKQQLWPILTVACSNSWHLKILDHQLWIVPKPFRSSRKALHYWPRLAGHKEVTIRINYCTRQCFSELSFLLIWGLDITDESKPIIPNIALGHPLFRDNVCR